MHRIAPLGVPRIGLPVEAFLEACRIASASNRLADLTQPEFIERCSQSLVGTRSTSAAPAKWNEVLWMTLTR
jgi:hypothetical protein